MNPFLNIIVSSAWNDTDTDVPEIHGEVFQHCLRGIENVRLSNASKGLLIYGEAGSGKTHLLKRLRAALTPQLPIASDRDETLFIWVRLQTSPRMIWRTLRRTLVADWFRRSEIGYNQFERILFHRLAEQRPAEKDLALWHEYMLDEDPAGLLACLDDIADQLELDRNTAKAFEHIAFKRHKRDVQAWLEGVSLPEAALERMEFTQDEGTDEEREDEARRVVLMLCRLAGEKLPIVMGFDQVEALQRKPGDKEALFSFGQLVSTLHDGANNLLLVSCVQSAFSVELLDHIRQADRERMTDNGTLSLDPLTEQQARRLLECRLEGTSHPAAPWPFSEAEFRELFEKYPALTPRQLLSLAAKQFENEIQPSTPKRDEEAEAVAETTTDEQSTTPEPDPFTEYLDATWEEAVEEKLRDNSPDRTEEIMRHALPLLAGIVAPDQELVRDTDLPDVAMVFEGPRGHAGVSICTQSNMNSLAACLKRLKDQFSGNALQRLAIVRDSRRPLSPSAKRTNQYLQELEAKGARLVYPSAEAIAALDALATLLSDAKSGDLAFGADSISPSTVEEWIRQNLPGEIKELADELLDMPPETASDADAMEILGTLLAAERVVPVQRVADELKRSTAEVSEIIERHPGHYRLLGDPPAVAFEVVETGDRLP